MCLQPCVCVWYCGGQKRALDVLGQELEMVVSCRVGAGNQTWVSESEASALFLLSHLSSRQFSLTPSFVVTSSFTFKSPYLPHVSSRNSAFISFPRVWCSEKHGSCFEVIYSRKRGAWSGAMQICRERLNVACVA